MSNSRERVARIMMETRPEEWPTLDEMPEPDTQDIEKIARANIEPEDA